MLRAEFQKNKGNGMKKAVISGATGAIGRALIEVLTAAGVEVLLLVRKGSPRAADIPSCSLVRKIACDIEDFAKIASVQGAPYEVFFHLAWKGTYGASREDAALQEGNVRGASDAVRLAARLGCHTFVGVGSQAEYGHVPVGTRIGEEQAPCPITAYGKAKCEARLRTRALCAAYGMRHVWARVFSVYGPYDRPETLVMSVISAFLRGEEAAVTRGEQHWDYLYSTDAARALLLLAEKGKSGECYNVASGETRPLAEYITAIRDTLSPNGKIRFGARPYREGEVMNLSADIAKLQRATGFVPTVPFDEGIQKTAQYCKREIKK